MWTITSEIKSAGPGLYTVRLIMAVESVKPFVYIEDTYTQTASVPDMYLLPEDVGNPHRENSVDLIFRTEAFATEMQVLIEEDLALLYLRYNQVQEVTDGVLFTNGPMENSSSSSSSSSSSTINMSTSTSNSSSSSDSSDSSDSTIL